jgi:hypothetical protein
MIINDLVIYHMSSSIVGLAIMMIIIIWFMKAIKFIIRMAIIFAIISAVLSYYGLTSGFAF